MLMFVLEISASLILLLFGLVSMDFSQIFWIVYFGDTCFVVIHFSFVEYLVEIVVHISIITSIEILRKQCFPFIDFSIGFILFDGNLFLKQQPVFLDLEVVRVRVAVLINIVFFFSSSFLLILQIELVLKVSEYMLDISQTHIVEIFDQLHHLNTQTGRHPFERHQYPYIFLQIQFLVCWFEPLEKCLDIRNLMDPVQNPKITDNKYSLNDSMLSYDISVYKNMNLQYLSKSSKAGFICLVSLQYPLTTHMNITISSSRSMLPLLSKSKMMNSMLILWNMDPKLLRTRILINSKKLMIFLLLVYVSCLKMNQFMI